VALIQANIESMPTYTMQCFQIPKEINHQIDKISRYFFSGKNSMKTKIRLWCLWARYAGPRRLGGLD